MCLEYEPDNSIIWISPPYPSNSPLLPKKQKDLPVPAKAQIAIVGLQQQIHHLRLEAAVFSKLPSIPMLATNGVMSWRHNLKSTFQRCEALCQAKLQCVLQLPLVAPAIVCIPGSKDGKAALHLWCCCHLPGQLLPLDCQARAPAGQVHASSDHTELLEGDNSSDSKAAWSC